MSIPNLNERAAFQFDLPSGLIAQRPLPVRSHSRLLHLGESLTDRQFADLPSLLQPNDLLVFNDTRVIPARVFGVKPSGGKVEIVLERVLGARQILAQVGTSKPLRSEIPILLAAGAEARLAGRQDDMFVLDLSVDAVKFFQAHGAMPLPPYIDREAEAADIERYQTVFSRELGAVAAPTAGLHFDSTVLNQCLGRGVKFAYLTLHVGAGTYQPLRTDDLAQHHMHSEFMQVTDKVCTQVAEARANGGRVIAVGTTVVRSLEAAASSGSLQPFHGDTNIFIRPGYQFKVVDALITNFHLPESTLLMLVCAFGGYERTMAAYRHAVAERYRFFSYGDAMFFERHFAD
jgi:S-adenosylmethionine:tRNA ribosyltransferase-isomerase